MIPLRFNTEKVMHMIQQLKILYIITGKVIFILSECKKKLFSYFNSQLESKHKKYI